MKSKRHPDYDYLEIWDYYKTGNGTPVKPKDENFNKLSNRYEWDVYKNELWDFYFIRNIRRKGETDKNFWITKVVNRCIVN